jgi:hypothetical protein
MHDHSIETHGTLLVKFGLAEGEFRTQFHPATIRIVREDVQFPEATSTLGSGAV